jgi:Xaa-Pro aminopeptidase
VDGFFLEIIAERKIAQHFEERVVERGPADIVDVTGPQAFLACGRASEIQFDLSKEVVFELVHPRGSEQNRWIPSRHEDVAGLADATFGFKERQIFFAEFVSFHRDVRVVQQGKGSGRKPSGSHSIAGMISVDPQRVTGADSRPTIPAAERERCLPSGRAENAPTADRRFNPFDASNTPTDFDSMTQRIERLVQSIADSDQPMDAILICNEVNVRYLSGFTGDSTWLLVRPDGQATLFSDRRYETQIADECPNLESAIRPPSQTLVALLAEYLGDLSLKTIGFEADHVQVSTLRQWQEQIESVQWTETSNLVETLRSIKDADELATIRRAISIAERSFLSVTNKLTPQMTELQIAHELEATMRSLGASGVAFDVIAGAEPNGALPHYHPHDIALADCRTLLIDWGARVDGYCSDLTRTLHKPNVRSATADRFEAAYQAVLESQEAAISAIRDGVEAIEVDRAARQVLQKAGLGDAFKHGLGHSFGLEIHEDPRMGPMSTDVLREGMVLTVEPGVYFEGEFGIRIEDDILVTADGFERLSTLPKGLDDCRLVV